MMNWHLITETCQNVALNEDIDLLSPSFIRTSLKFLVMVVGGMGRYVLG